MQLPDELAPSLRQLRPLSGAAGTPAEAFQDALQRRGVMEPRHRVKAHRARYKAKRFAKSTVRVDEAPRRVSQRYVSGCRPHVARLVCCRF